MGKGWAAGLLLIMVLLSGWGIVAWSQVSSKAIYIIGADEPDTSLSLELVAGYTEKIVVRDSRLAGLYIEALGNTAGPGSYEVEIVNSTIGYLVVSPSSVAVRLVDTVINNSRISTVAVSSWHLMVSGVRAHWMNLSVVKGVVKESKADAISVYVSGSVRILRVEAGGFIVQDVGFKGSHILVDGSYLDCTSGGGSRYAVNLLGTGNTSITLTNTRLSCVNRTVIMGMSGFKEAIIYNSSLGSINGYTTLEAGKSKSPSSVYIGESTISGNLQVKSERIHIEKSRIGKYWPNGTIIRRIRGLQTAVYLLMFHYLLIGESRINAYSLLAAGYNSSMISSTIIATYTDLILREGLYIENTRLLIQSLNIGHRLYNLRIVGSVIAGNIYVKSFLPTRSPLIQLVNDRFTQTSGHVSVYVVQSDYPLRVELDDSIIDNPGFVFSFVSNPLSPSKEQFTSRGVYWASPLGPTIVLVNGTERRGGATVSIITPDASVNLASWKATPLGPVVKPCSGNPELMAGPGRYAFGSVNGECALILDAERLVDKVWVYSKTPLQVKVAGLKGIIANATVSGNTTITLPEAATILIIYYEEAGVQAASKSSSNTTTTTTTTTTTSQISSQASEKANMRSRRSGLTWPVVGLILTAALVGIGYYFYTINKKS